MEEVWDIRPEEVTNSELYEIAQKKGILEMLAAIKAGEWDDWRLIWGVLLFIQQERDYSKGWLAYKLEELKAPLEVWQQLAQYNGFKKGWAYYRWQEQNQQGITNNSKNSKQVTRKKAK